MVCGRSKDLLKFTPRVRCVRAGGSSIGLLMNLPRVSWRIEGARFVIGLWYNPIRDRDMRLVIVGSVLCITAFCGE